MNRFTNSLKEFFAHIKWWEYIYMALIYIAMIVFGVVFNSGALVIINAIISSTAIFFIAKGMVIGNILGIGQCVLYSVISYFNNLYGEMILCLCITMPIYIASICTWIKNLRKKEKVVKVNRMLSVKEWTISIIVIACVTVGIYFLLRALNTANLIVSTVNVGINIMSGYLLIKRSEFNFIFYILNNIVSIVLWATVIAGGATNNVPTLVLFIVFLILNIIGFVNWVRLKKSQAKDGEEGEDKSTLEVKQIEEEN